jgi:hypothetical protein
MRAVRRPPVSPIERLEQRCAPAVLLSPAKLRYFDVDGDVVIVSSSKGSFDLLTDFTFVAAGLGEQLQRISLSRAEFAGADLTIQVRQSGGGDGVTNIGYIDARSLDLGEIRVAGDLGRIEAGDSDFASAGIGLLKVRTFGRHGTGTQSPENASTESHVSGDLLSMRVVGRMEGALLTVTGAPDGTGGNLGNLSIGGSLRGGVAAMSGVIQCSGTIASAYVAGSVVGGSGDDSGSILADHGIGSVIVAGSLESGDGLGSGSIRAGADIGSVLIKKSILGSEVAPVIISAAGDNSGDAIQKLRVAGKVRSGSILAGYDLAGTPVNGDSRIGKIVVAGNWVASSAVAGAAAGADGVFGTEDDAIHFPHSPSITARIATIQILGEVRGTSGSATDHFGFVAEEIGELAIRGSAVHLLPGPSNDHDATDPRLALGTDGDVRITEVLPTAPPPTLLAAVSRKIHSAAGAFDIALPLVGPAGVESRADGTLTLVFSFDREITAGAASVSSGSANITEPPVFAGNEVIVNVSDVTDIQTIVIQLTDLAGDSGGILPSVHIAVGILQADVNGTRAVNASDVNLIRAATAAGTIDATNFRMDIDLNGTVDSTDVNVARSKSGNQLD